MAIAPARPAPRSLRPGCTNWPIAWRRGKLATPGRKRAEDIPVPLNERRA